MACELIVILFEYLGAGLFRKRIARLRKVFQTAHPGTGHNDFQLVFALLSANFVNIHKCMVVTLISIRYYFPSIGKANLVRT